MTGSDERLINLGFDLAEIPVARCWKSGNGLVVAECPWSGKHGNAPHYHTHGDPTIGGPDSWTRHASCYGPGPHRYRLDLQPGPVPSWVRRLPSFEELHRVDARRIPVGSMSVERMRRERRQAMALA